jgi:teichuronic acid biosynthesis glycosyltransferase TuaC
LDDEALLAAHAEPLNDVDDSHAARMDQAHRMRVAVVTKIFPNSLEPLSAPFNRQQLAELRRRCDLDVLVAIPHTPLASTLAFPERAARLAALPAGERVHGLDVTYVRQLYVPRVGLALAVPLYLASLAPHRERLRAADVVLATWAYPDGCAAVLAARALGKPCVVKVHGTDVNVVLKRPSARTVAAYVLPMADAVVAVSRPLAEEIETLGVPRNRVHVVTNGVDESLFYPRDRAATRRALGLAEDALIVLFVGRLEPQKGIGELLAAFEGVRARLPKATLVTIGDGVSRLDACARAAGWGPGAARMLGPIPHAEVAAWMGACNLLALPSWAEGTPNVVLEALASGRPVVATSVGGIPDVICSPRVGRLVPPKNAEALRDALCGALSEVWDEGAIRTFGPPTWPASALELWRVVSRAASIRPSETRPKRGRLLCFR